VINLNTTQRVEAIRAEDKRMGKSESPLHPLFTILCRQYISKNNRVKDSKGGKHGNETDSKKK
jgi:hypothetical protein